MKITVVIPMYNESKIIEKTAIALSEYMRENFDDYEIIFSDDGSNDASAEIVRRLALPCTRVLGEGQNHGKGYAVKQGMLSANGEICIFTDADLAYGTEVIGEAVRFMTADISADMLIGSRNLDIDGYCGYTFKRKFMSKVYIKILCIAGGFKLSDSQCGFKAFRNETAKQIFSECTVDGFAFDFDIILRAGIHNRKITEMPVKVINHRESSVKPIGDAVKMLGDLKRIKKQIKKERREHENGNT